ncbi:hypothetical protein JCM11641_003358 [Rhodosporidiobolus odoratus]
MSAGDGFQSTSAVSLDALLEEPSTRTTASNQPQAAAVDAVQDAEPVPTLASLLLSTAESLAARSTAPSSAAPPKRTQAKRPPPQFQLAISPKALLSNPVSSGYLSSLLAQPLTALQSLPTSLSNLTTSLDNDLSSLAFTRYSSFLLSYTSAQSISTSFTTLSDSLSALLDSTSALETAASSFETRVHTVRGKRERFSRVRERIEEVEELLEAPGVVDACVRAGYWSEAIDVAVRLEELHRRLRSAASPDREEGKGALQLLDRVGQEVSLALLSLRARVLESLLQRSLKLPGAVRCIGILRRIAGRAPDPKKELDEDGLRLVFLTARWRCLRTELETVEAQMTASGVQLGGSSSALPASETTIEENEERARWTKRWIEAWREIVGETIGMYTEVFLSSTALSASSSSTITAPQLDPFTLPVTPVDPSSPLHLFLSTSLESLTSTLTHALPFINSPSSLSSFLTQLTYCSHSFARHGLDFREVLQLRERIELRLGRIIAADFEMAGRKWEKEWRSGWENSGGTGTTAAKARRSGRTPISDWLVMPEGLSTLLSTPLPPSPSRSADPPSAWHHQPSPSLALLPPLARFLNAHATALNALRLLPSASLYLPLRRAQAAELDRATQVLAAFTDAWLVALNATPLLAQTGFSGSNATGKGQEDALSEDEKQLLREREDERKVVAASIAWFGRQVVPWCEGALGRGVYAELVESERLGLEGRKREESVKEAVKRCEQLVARIEGRDWVDEEVQDADEMKKEKQKEGKPEEAAELPVLDAPADPLVTTQPSPTAAAPVLTNGDLTEISIPTSAAPVDFSIPSTQPPRSAVVDSEPPAPPSAGADSSAPYLVNDVAPPAPVPNTSSPVDPKEIELAGVGEEGISPSEVVVLERDNGMSE